MAGEDFTLKGKVELDTTGLAQPTTDAKGLTSEFTNLFGGLSSTTVAMAGVSAAAVGLSAAIVSLTDSAYEAYCEYDRLGYTIGVTASEMAKWNKVAIYADSTAQSLATMLGKLSVNISDVGPGGEKARQILEDMGVAVYDVEGNIRPLTEIFPEMIGGLERTTNAAERNGKAMDLVGRGYKELAGYMILGQEGIEEVYNRSGSLSEAQQADLGALEDRWKDLNGTMGKTKTVLGAELAPAVYAVVDAVDTLMKIDNGKFFKEIVEGVELAVDAFKVLVRGITLTIIALEYLNALTHGDFAGAESIRAKGAAYVESYQAKDKEDAFNTAWDAAGGKTTRGGGGSGTGGTAGATGTTGAGTDTTKYGAADYTPAEIGEMATRLGVTVPEVIKRLNAAGEANKYGVSVSQMGETSGSATDSNPYAGNMSSGGGDPGSMNGNVNSDLQANFASTAEIWAYAKANKDQSYQSDAWLAKIRGVAAGAESIQYSGGGNWGNSSENQGIIKDTASLWAQYQAQKAGQAGFTQINYIQGDNAQAVANAIAEATSRAIARQVVT